MNIIFLGPQGAGKGTQARLLAEKLNLFYLESGSFLRKVASRDPRVDKIINKKGRLLPDSETFNLIKDYLEEERPDWQGVVFDGYPRSIPQYELLKAWLGEKGAKIDMAILIYISDEESVRRLSARRICEACGEVYNLITNFPPKDGCKCGGKLVQRPDDRPEAIVERLKEYKKTTEPLIEVFEKEGILTKVDGERPIETISEEILGIVTRR
jgi:adenylate kinase